MNVSPDLRHELTLLVLSRYPLVAIESTDEGKVDALVTEVARDLSLPLIVWKSSDGLVRARGQGLRDTRDPDRALASILDIEGKFLALFHDLHPYFDRPEIVRRLRDVQRQFSSSHTTLVLSGVEVRMPSDLVAQTALLQIALPGVKELQEVLRRTAEELSLQRGTRIELSQKEARQIARALKGLQSEEARRILYQAALRDGKLNAADLPDILRDKRQRLRVTGVLDWVESLSGFANLGGAPQLKRWVARRHGAFSGEARRFGLDSPKGILLVGVPGSGKSLACRALAGEWTLPLLRLDTGRLYDKFVGETEANLRRALATAEAMSPAVLWIDEIEKALAAGGGHADDGLSQRVLGTLLTWMQDRPQPVFLVATANRVEALPVELLRRGRFDEVFFFDLPRAEERAPIFAIHLERRGRRPGDFDLGRLAAAADGFSGAEIEGVVVAALYHAFSERSPLTTEILLEEIAATRPLAVLRPQEIARIRQWGKEHAVPA